MSDELMKRAKMLMLKCESDDPLSSRSRSRIASTIRDLLAEVEAQRKRGDEVIAVLRCLRDVCTTPGETKADFVERIKAVLGADPDARVESLYAAEARLRELASAEPVAWQWLNSGNFRTSVCGRANADEWFPLIRRPEMPS